MIIIPNVNKENSCLDCPVWSLCWDSKPTEDICKDRCPIIEPKQGQWKPFDLTWGRSIYACTNCGEAFEVPTEGGKPMYDYCPYCGARMIAEVEDDN